MIINMAERVRSGIGSCLLCFPAASIGSNVFQLDECLLIVYIKPPFEVISGKMLEDINQEEQAASFTSALSRA